MNDEPLPHSLAEYVAASVGDALTEDVGPGDLTAALVPPDQWVTARIVARDAGIVCGQPWCDEVFRQIDPSVEITWRASEGAALTAGDNLCEIYGPARAVLTGERTALNFLQLLSATATHARRYVDAVHGSNATILDTRKTIPGLRLAQKYAVRVGGASNHRIGLYDAILIKENHIAAAGGIQAAVDSAIGRAGDVLIELEVENLAQLAEGLRSGAQRLLLDNFTVEDLAAAVESRNSSAAGVELEASGGITLENVRAVAETGVDFVSVGALTKDIEAIDLSMRIDEFD
ncbi:MAG: carboxylating nicotinate-nucleotide diphosphorylase [Gammaproteobacteria bacterium]